MTYERADLNWYTGSPDYYGTRAKPAAPTSAVNAAARADAGPESAAPQIASSQTDQRATSSGSEASGYAPRHGDSHDTAAGSFTFDDLLDIVNPLHHLPVIGMAYRALTGDTISAHAQILGGGLYGGGSGFVSAIANAISEEASGRDIASNLVAAVLEDQGPANDPLATRFVSPRQMAEADGFGQDWSRRPTRPAPAEDLAQLPAPPDPSPAAGPSGPPTAEAAAAIRQTASAAPTLEAAATPAAPAAKPSVPAASPETEAVTDAAAGPATLSGRDALSALAADLRSLAGDRPPRSGPAPRPAPARQPGPVLGAATPSPDRSPARPAARQIAPQASPGAPGSAGVNPALLLAAQRQAGADDLQPGAFTDRMLLGLQKYRALSAGPGAGGLTTLRAGS